MNAKTRTKINHINTRNLIFIDDDRFLKTKGAKLNGMSIQFDDGSVMTPTIKRGRIAGFTAVDADGRSLPVIHLHTQATKRKHSKNAKGKHTAKGSGATDDKHYKKAKKPIIVKLPPAKPGSAECWHCRCTDKTCVCVPAPCT